MQSTGGLRVFDGLFVGDQHTARDEQYMLMNQITLVINLTNQQIWNYFQHYNIRYINYSWEKITKQNNLFEGLCFKINENLQREESVFIHGLSHLDEPLTLCAVFIMIKFRWSLYKTLQFLQARIPQLIFNADSFNILKICQLKLLNSENRLSYNWQVRPENEKQLILRNTYLNSSKGHKNKKYLDSSYKKNRNTQRKVVWNLSHISNLLHTQSYQIQTKGIKEDSRRNRVILTVKKIISESANKENRRNTGGIDKVNKCTQKPKLNKLKTKNESLQLMKKYKSFYSLASLPSIERQQTHITQQSQNVQISRLPLKLEKCQNGIIWKDMIKTQKSEKYSQSQSKFVASKISLIKTQNTDYINLNQDNTLSSNNSQIFSRKNSLIIKKQKQNLSSVSKIQLRKQTPRKKYQMNLHK